MRARWLFVVLAFLTVPALVLGGTRPARADNPVSVFSNPSTDDVTILTPPPVPAAANPTPEIAPPADLTPFLDLPVVSVDVAISSEDQRVWPDVRAPTIGTLKPGDPFTRPSVRDAIGEGFDVVVLRDAMRAVNMHPGDGARAERDMAEAGAELVTSKQLVGSGA